MAICHRIIRLVARSRRVVSIVNMSTISQPWRGGVPLNPRTALSDLIAKVFSAPFAKVFSSPITSPGAAAIPWYLSGGIAAANVRAAYNFAGAASYAAAKLDITTGGNNYNDGVAMGWDATNGLAFANTKYLQLASAITTHTQVDTLFVHVIGATRTGQFAAIIGVYSTYSFSICSYISTGRTRFFSGNTTGNNGFFGNTSGNVTLAMAGNKIFINGADTGQTIAGTDWTGTQILTIGTQAGEFIQTGYFRRMAHYSRILTPTELLAIHTAALLI